MKDLQFPSGAKFAFSIIDDTDVATLENVRPIYEFLDGIGLRTTKTVWVLDCDNPRSNFRMSDTIERPDYRDFALGLKDRGFELTWHCPTMESSKRSEVIEGLEKFVSIFGASPRVHANHALNRENIYWGERRFDDPIIRRLYRQFSGQSPDYYQGHIEGSDYWWGDLCTRHVDYVRNLTFASPNLLRVNPTLPYHDSSRPLVKSWFSAVDAENCAAFNGILGPKAQDRLVAEGGICIVATHLGKGFVRDGKVNPTTRELLARLASLPGWFAPVGEILDWLKQVNGIREIPSGEWRRMQWHWAADYFKARLTAKAS